MLASNFNPRSLQSSLDSGGYLKSVGPNEWVVCCELWVVNSEYLCVDNGMCWQLKWTHAGNPDKNVPPAGRLQLQLQNCNCAKISERQLHKSEIDKINLPSINQASKPFTPKARALIKFWVWFWFSFWFQALDRTAEQTEKIRELRHFAHAQEICKVWAPERAAKWKILDGDWQVKKYRTGDALWY